MCYLLSEALTVVYNQSSCLDFKHVNQSPPYKYRLALIVMNCINVHKRFWERWRYKILVSIISIQMMPIIHLTFCSYGDKTSLVSRSVILKYQVESLGLRLQCNTAMDGMSDKKRRIHQEKSYFERW
jgi:hypothetical protein